MPACPLMILLASASVHHNQEMRRKTFGISRKTSTCSIFQTLVRTQGPDALVVALQKICRHVFLKHQIAPAEATVDPNSALSASLPPAAPEQHRSRHPERQDWPPRRVGPTDPASYTAEILPPPPPPPPWSMC